jgi:hypothetical protein
VGTGRIVVIGGTGFSGRYVVEDPLVTLLQARGVTMWRRGGGSEWRPWD